MERRIDPAAEPVAFAIVAAPWGPIHVAADRRTIVGLEVLTPPGVFAERLALRLRRPVDPGRSRLLERAMGQVEAYLAGTLRSFDLPIDLGPATDWDRAVLGGVRRVPWGGVTSYGRLARSIGRPGAARAAGGSVGRNPIGLLIPCHRVIAGDGSLGGYGGAWFGTRDQLLAIKRELLDLEGVRLPAEEFAV